MRVAAIFGCAGTVLGPIERAFFAEAQPWGFILFARNVADPSQLAGLVRDLRAAVGRDAPVLIDQEGGRVARLRPPHWREWEDVGVWAARLPEPELHEALRLRYRLIADELRAVGIDVNCAPLLDIRRPETHAIIGGRALGETAGAVAARARAVRDGLEAGGVLPVVKHMPGHGRAALDSHEALPVVDAPLDTLRAEDFAPFFAHADAPLGMTAHVLFTALDPDRCATQSPRIVRAIRDEIGFDGLLMTDDLSMGALEGPVATRVERAIAAGCDLVLHCNGDLAQMTKVAAAAPRLTGIARRRADAAEAARRPPRPFEADAAERRLEDILGQAVYA